MVMGRRQEMNSDGSLKGIPDSGWVRQKECYQFKGEPGLLNKTLTLKKRKSGIAWCFPNDKAPPRSSLQFRAEIMSMPPY